MSVPISSSLSLSFFLLLFVVIHTHTRERDLGMKFLFLKQKGKKRKSINQSINQLRSWLPSMIPNRDSLLLEVCVDTVDTLHQWLQYGQSVAGRRRIELCGRLVDTGGVTPKDELIHAAVQAIEISGADCPIFVMIRLGPEKHEDFREFILHDSHIEAMLSEMENIAQKFGKSVQGVVFGCLQRSHDNNDNGVSYCIDTNALRRLCDTARDLGFQSITFHRAMDKIVAHHKNPCSQLELLIQCGVDRVLTSGDAKRAVDALESLSELHRCANGRITIIPGGSVRVDNYRQILEACPTNEIHSSTIF